MKVIAKRAALMMPWLGGAVVAWSGCIGTSTSPATGGAQPSQAAQGVAARAAQEDARGDRALERLSGMSDADLRALFESTKSERRLAFREFDREVSSAYRRAMSAGGDAQRQAVARALRAALGDFATRSPAALVAQVTERGAADEINLDLRDATLHLAMLARLTNDRSHADRAAALLARFAQVIPKWPIWNPYHAPISDRTPLAQEDRRASDSEFAAGLWGQWIYMDLLMGAPLAEAFAILEPTGAVDRLGAAASIRAMFDRHLEVQRRFNPTPDFSNMDAFQIRGLMEFGRWLNRPELVHRAVRHLRDMYRTSFYPDGWWHEAATAYHADLQNGLRDIAEEMLIGYSDPAGFTSSVDGTRFDDLNLIELVRRPSERADRVLRRSVMPDGNYFASRDTPWPLAAPRGSMPPRRSFLFGCMGQGSVISGVDDGFAMATLHWGKTSSHAHFDALNLNFWAKGVEAISETQYQPISGSNSTRAWHAATAGHATVVVDGVNQAPRGKNGSRMRRKQPDDAIAGIDDWRWRWSTQSAQDGGDLRLFSALVPEVQVIEADATRAYDMPTDITMYRRTIALVRIDDDDSYLVDIFRIKGGTTCDFMLRAALQLETRLRLSVPVTPMPGSAHTMLRNLRGAETDGPWLAAFEMAGGVTLLTFMAGAPGTTVIEARGPAMRRVGDAPFVIARRSGPETTFVAVHHVIRGAVPRVQGIELIPVECPGCVALQVRIGDRTDTVVSCEDRSKGCTLPGGIEVRGAFAHIAGGTVPAQQWALLVDGDLLRTPQASIEGETSYEGVVRATRRIEAGDAVDGFVIDEGLPEGSALRDAVLIVDLAGEMSWGYSIDLVSRRDGSTVIQTDEPGLIIEPGRIKQTYFPNWGFRGDAKYRIPGQAIARPLPNRLDPPPTGAATVRWRGDPP